MENLTKAVIVGIGTGSSEPCQELIKKCSSLCRGELSLLIYEKDFASIRDDICEYDAIFFVSELSDEACVNRAIKLSRSLSERLCLCIFLDERGVDLPLDAPSLIIPRGQLVSSFMDIYASLNGLSLIGTGSPIKKRELSLSRINEKIHFNCLDSSCYMLVVVNSKRELSLKQYNRIAFSILRGLGSDCEACFSTKITKELENSVVISIYTRAKNSILGSDKANYTKEL